MKRTERHLRDIFSDSSLEIDPRFKRKLKEDVMASTNKPIQTKRSIWLVPAAVLVSACLLFVLTQVPIKNNTNGDKKPIIELPTAETVSAATLSQKSKVFKQNLAKVPFIVQTASMQTGPQYQTCSQGLMGPQPGEVWTTYVYMSKNSGAEAFYLTKRAADGSIRQRTSYYNPSSSQLGGIIDNLIGHPFVLDEASGMYMEIDKNGAKLDNGQYAPVNWNGKKVYVVYAAAPDGDARCSNDEVVTKFILDATTYALIATERYRGLFDQSDNLIYRYTEDITTEQLSEKQALARMTSAGFDKAGAFSEFPGHLGE